VCKSQSKKIAFRAAITFATKKKAIAASRLWSSRLEAPLGVRLELQRGKYREDRITRTTISGIVTHIMMICNVYHNDISWHLTGTFVRMRGKGKGEHRQCPYINDRPVDDIVSERRLEMSLTDTVA